jgi:nucleotide-binding universal stress UspA family protein
MTEGLQRRSESPDPWRRGDGRPVVVVGVNGSAASRSAALAASSTARAVGGAVVAVHVATLSPWQAIAACLGAGQVLVETGASLDREMQAELATLFELESVPWRFVSAHGAVEDALARIAAELHATLVVVGNPRRSRRGRLTHLFAPSVPRRMLRTTTDRLLIA